VLVLAIDTSSATTSVAVLRAAGDPWGAEVLAEASALLANAAGERLIGVVEQVLGAAGLTFAEIELVAVGVGPGSFTGTRVGVATAKGLCIATGKPLRGVSAFDALAVDAGARAGEQVLVAIDARKSEVYCALVTCGLDDVVTLDEPRHLPPDRVEGAFAHLGRGEVARVAGDGVPLVASVAALRTYRIAPHAPRAAAIGALAGARQRRAPHDEVDVLEPLYVRPPDITLPKSPPGMPGRLKSPA
jgi:tRNA threonylcarbamoyladenosine biosynthesis protein TsaB